jgi:hypothetical protein
MTKAKISEYDAVAANNTDVNGVNIDEGCAPSGMNNMGREIMAALKRFETGADGDSLTVGGNLIVSGTSTVAALNTSGAVVFNDAGADVDFRVEGDTNANLIVADAGVDKVGIGTNTFNTNGGVLQVSNGISFPATQSACADANTLDDYEEGTFTPVITFGGASVGITYSAQSGVYTKVGNVVTCQIRIVLSNKGSSSGQAKIANLPFTVTSGEAGLSAPAFRISSMTFADVYGGYTDPSTTEIYLEEVTNAGTQSGLTNSDFTNSTNIIATVSYRVA